MIIPNAQLEINFNLHLLDSPIKDIVAFAEAEVIQSNTQTVLFRIRGYSVRVYEFGNKPTFLVNAPAFRSGPRFKKSFIVDDKELWSACEKEILTQLSEKNGGLSAYDYWNKYFEKGGDIDIPL